MTRRAPVGPLTLGAVAVVAAVAWWIPAGPPEAVPPVGSDDVAAMSGEASPSQAADEEMRGPVPAAIEDGHEGLDAASLWEYLNDPANSDLGAEDFAEYTQLGMDLLRADVTGEGRERWPDRWSSTEGGRSEPCCADLTIHAAGAYTDPTDAGSIRVTIIWSGEALNGSVLSGQLADLTLPTG